VPAVARTKPKEPDTNDIGMPFYINLMPSSDWPTGTKCT
jgi:hypothetical protein